MPSRAANGSIGGLSVSGGQGHPSSDLEVVVEDAALLLWAGVRPGAPYLRLLPEEGACCGVHSMVADDSLAWVEAAPIAVLRLASTLTT